MGKKPTEPTPLTVSAVPAKGKPSHKPKPKPGNGVKRPRGRPAKTRTKIDRPASLIPEARPDASVRVRKTQHSARKIDWTQIEMEYVQGVMIDGKRTYSSYKDLAHDYGVSFRSVQAHSGAGRWHEKREEFASELRRKMYEITPERVAEIHANNLNTMKIFVDLAAAKLGNKDANFATDHAALSKADIREARELLQIAKEAAEAMRAMLGLPSNITEQRVTQNTSTTQQVAASVNVDIASAAAKSPDMVAALAAAMQAISTQKPADGAP